jgi:antitoxin ParD1/3/4
MLGNYQRYQLLLILCQENRMSSKNTSISLGEHFSGFIEAQVRQGRYGTASDVMRAASRLLEEREARLEAMRAALVEGEQSGLSKPFDFEAFIARKRESQPIAR